MVFEVVITELQSSATEHREHASSLGADPVDMAAGSPTKVGHVELAVWMDEINDQVSKGHKALREGQENLVEAMMDAASDYERTDDQVAAGLHPFLSPALGIPAPPPEPMDFGLGAPPNPAPAFPSGAP